jgi:methyltransferase (TIGR00027 family)
VGTSESAAGKREPAVRNISDTARWAAYFRAQETQRGDALFRDPYAERLAGPRGTEIANTLPEGNKHEWAWVARTYLFDHFIEKAIAAGTDLVVNLAAGLDARPYRMKLPASLQWAEIDLPEPLAYKELVLSNDKPVCDLQRIRLDLANQPARRALFAQLNSRAKKALVLTEGLLVYLSPEEVGELAKDLAACRNFCEWITDLSSPGLLRMMQRTSGKELSKVGAPFKFGPLEGPGFFAPYGWNTADVQGLLKTAARFGRPPLLLRMLAHLPESKRPPGNRPWSGVCSLANACTATA